MLSTWTEEGQPPEVFWRVTPRVFTAVLQGRLQARIRAERDILKLAWHNENFARHKRLPNLEALLKSVGKDELPEQTPEDMVAILSSIDAGRGLMEFKFIPHPVEE